MKHIKILVTSGGFALITAFPVQAQQNVIDIDGNVYSTVQIGEQLWMVENLKTTRYRDGSQITNLTSDSEWSGLTTGAWAHYHNDSVKDSVYGKLYNWYAAVDHRGLCPVGWHVPTDEEWTQLSDYLGGESVAGDKMKATGTDYWASPNGATNESGFMALPGGNRYFNGSLSNQGPSASFWSSSEYGSDFAWHRRLYDANSVIYRNRLDKRDGFSIRCLRDSQTQSNLPPYLPKDGLTAWYPFNGNANDESGNGNNGTVIGASSTEDRFENANSAYDFNGSDSYISLSEPFFNGIQSVSSFTYSVWIKVDSYPLNGTTFTISNKEGYWRTIGLRIGQDGQVGFVGSQPSPQGYFGIDSGDELVAMNKWTLINVTFESGVLKIFLNGDLLSTARINYNAINFEYLEAGNSTSTNLIGAHHPKAKGISSLFDGQIDDFAIWNRALTEEEIKDLYTSSNNNTTPGIDLESGLIAHYPFDGDSEDKTSNQNHATVHGAVQSTDRFGVENQSYALSSENKAYLRTSKIIDTHPNNFSYSFWVNPLNDLLISTEGGEVSGRRQAVIHPTHGEVYGPHENTIGIGVLVGLNGVIVVEHSANLVKSSLTSVRSISGWSHISIVYKNGTPSLYVDGIFDKSGLASTRNAYPSFGFDRVYSKSGFGGAFNHEFFDGAIDEIRIYNRALSEDEVDALYELESTNPDYAEVQFSTNLRISNSTGLSSTLTIGIDESATLGYDEGLDALAPPPAPSGTFDARLLRGEDAYFTDVVPASDSAITWRMSFAAGTDGLPLTVSWDPESFAEAGSFTLRDNIDGSFVSVNMRADSTVSISQSFITELLVVYETLSEVTTDYQKDWNLVGLPVSIDHDGYRDLFEAGMGNTLYSFDQSYVPRTTLENGLGYWLRMSQANTQTFKGRPLGSVQVGLKDGWNIISGPEGVLNAASILDPDGVIVSGTLYGFVGTYVPAQTLDPGKGYWIRASKAGTITLDLNAPPPPPSKARWADPEGYRLEFRSGQAVSSILLDADLGDGRSYELPPRPVRGAYDVRLEDQRWATEASSAVVLVQGSAGQPTVLSVKDASGRGDGGAAHVEITFLNGPVELGTITAGWDQSVEMHPDADRVRVSAMESEKVREFRLDQNFPNPFNPSTVIRYALPAAEEVRLEVFSVLGQRVAVLADGPMQAGWHEARFDASGLASGVYVYRLTSASGFTQTRRLMLVK